MTLQTDIHNFIITITSNFSCELNNHFNLYKKLLLGPIWINGQLRYQQEFRKQFKTIRDLSTPPSSHLPSLKRQTHT